MLYTGPKNATAAFTGSTESENARKHHHQLDRQCKVAGNYACMHACLIYRGQPRQLLVLVH